MGQLSKISTAPRHAPQCAPESAPAPAINLDLVRKYSGVAAPRYTSYPPATKFSADLDALRLGDAIRDDNLAENNSSLHSNWHESQPAGDGANRPGEPRHSGRANRPGEPRYSNGSAGGFALPLPSLPLDSDKNDSSNSSDSGGAAAGALRPLSLYFHLPFCESRCWYCGCTAVITKNRGEADAYLDGIERELELVARLLDPRRRVTQLHLGGGTPTFLTPAQLGRLNALARARFSFAPDAEVSVEIDPRGFTPGHVRALREFGATRASLGVQDTDERVQLAIHRHQPRDLNTRAVAWLREAGFESVNLDLIYGLPLQTPASFARTLDDALALSPDRLSVFSYAHVPWLKPAQRIFENRGQLPGDEDKLAMFALAHERLTSAGFVDIGLDHFAKPGDELAAALREGALQRNFQGYSTRAGASLYAFGMSSISQTPDAYWQNTKDMAAYHAMLADGKLPLERGLRLGAEDKRRREIVMRVMCARKIDYAMMSARLGVDFTSAYAGEIAALSGLAADGIVRMSGSGFEVTPEGVPLLRVVAMCFDATLAKGAVAGVVAGAPGQHARVI